MSEIYYKLYDRNKKLKDIIGKSDEKFLGKNVWLNGVSCFVIDENGKILIEQRINKGLTPGKLDLCSGHIDGHESSTQAMIRELQEELGINMEDAMKINKLTEKESIDLQFESKGKIKNFFIDFYCLNVKNFEPKIQKEEISQIKWVDMEECFEMLRSGKTKFPAGDYYEKIFEKVKQNFKGIKCNLKENEKIIGE